MVLISTYWNVNCEKVKEWEYEMCFNLNLLECKSSYSHIVDGVREVLISTYWNVNTNMQRDDIYNLAF